MFGLAILGIAAFLAVMNLFTAVIVPTIPDILTDVPTLYDYDVDGKKIVDVSENNLLPDDISSQIDNIRSQIDELQDQMNQAVQNNDWDTYNSLSGQVEALNTELDNLDFGVFTQPNQRLELYWFFAYPALFALVILIMFSLASHYWEKGFGIFKKGTSMGIMKTSIIGIITILIVPEFWDIFAINMKQLSMYLLDPFNGNPEITTQRLWCKMGCIVNIDGLLNQDAWEIGLSNPSNFGQSLLVNALLPLFKAVPTAMLSITLFVIAKVRVLFIMIILLTLPICLDRT